MFRIDTRPARQVVAVIGAMGLVVSACRPEAPRGEDAGMASVASAEVTVDSVGFMTPESVLYDSAADMYLVSNINGSPVAADSNGFISRLNPDGTVAELKWIDGTAEGIRLDAPKGMAIVGDVLFVSDLTSVRKFDRTTGAPLGEVAIPGSTFLNDIAAAPDGGIYLTDTGWQGTADGFAPSGTDAVYHVTPGGEVHTLIANDSLGNPNGVAVGTDGTIWVVTYGTGELYRVADGAIHDRVKLPTGQLDGVEVTADGTLLISSWEGQVVYRGQPGGTFTEAVSGVEAPADIGYDAGRHQVLIPLFMGNAVALRPVGM